jgi:hypothetical protein
MEIIVIILFIVVIALLRTDTPSFKKVPHCKSHKWAYTEDNQLKCDVCHYTAGQDSGRE